MNSARSGYGLNKDAIFILFLIILYFGCISPTLEYSLEKIPGKPVWTGEGPDTYTGDISPDGRYFSDINWDTGNLDLVDLESGEIRPLTNYGYVKGGYAWTSAFSSNGRQLAFEWYNYEKDAHELKLYSFDNDQTRILIPAKEKFTFVEPLDWSPDDQQVLLALKEEQENWEFALLSVEDGSLSHLKSLDWRAPGGGHPHAYPHAQWSPDGRFIGYDYVYNTDNSWDIVAMSVKDGKETILVEGEGADRFFSWNADGSKILFYSDRSGIPSLWQLAVENGKPVGKPELIAENVPGLAPIGLSKKGFSFGINAGTRNTYVASINTESGEIMEVPKPVDQITWHRNNVGDWSDDGNWLLYITFDELPASKERAVIMSLDGTARKEIPFPDNFHNKTGTVAWISDEIVLLDGQTPIQSGVHQFNLNTGEVSMPVNFGEHGFFQRFKSHPEGSEIYVEMRDSDPEIVAINTKTGSERTIVKGSILPASMAVSPAGDKIAYLTIPDSDGFVSLQVVSLSDGEKQIIHREKQGVLQKPVAWTANAKRILVGVRAEGENSGLWSIPVDKPGIPVFISLPEPIGNALLVNPDGHHIAFQSGTSTGRIYNLDWF